MKLSLFILMLGAAFSAWGNDLKTPDINANTLFLYRNSNYHKENTNTTTPDQERNGLSLQEAELQFYSDVDPYTRLNLLLSIHSSYKASGGSVEEKWQIEPEEAFVESNAVQDLTLKIGKFKAYMGKHNTLHTHAYNFIDAPLANVSLLGDEGLNDVGVSGAYLLPTSWFSELTLQYLRGEAENSEFNSPTPGDGVGLVHWKNLTDLSDSLTMEIGASYASGANSVNGNTDLTGGDLTFKWRPSEGGLYHSLLWSTEYLSRHETQNAVPDETSYGWASWVQYQFAERWAALYRYDDLNVSNSFSPTDLANGFMRRNSAGLVYMPSEFASYKFEYDQRNGGVAGPNGGHTENKIYLQANFTIGSHPAHAY